MKRNTIKQIVFATTSSLIVAGIVLVSPPFVKAPTTVAASSSVQNPVASVANTALTVPKFAAGSDDSGSDD